MNKYFLLATALSSVVAFSGCSNDEGKKGPTKSQADILKEAASVTDYSTKITPANFTVIKADLSADEEKEMYDIGCVKPGELYGKSIDEMDNRFVIGQIFTRQSGYHELKRAPGNSTTEKKVIKVQAQSYDIENNILVFTPTGPFQKIEDAFTQKPHYTDRMSYEIKHTDTSYYRSEKSENLQNNYTQAAVNYIANIWKESYTYLDCSVDYKNKDYKYSSKLSKISYVFNGKTITAFLRKSITTGAMVCKQYTFKPNTNGSGVSLNDMKPDFEAEMGSGSEERIEITSNEAVNQGFYNCGGTELYSSRKTALDSGKILSTHADKMLTNPLR